MQTVFAISFGLTVLISLFIGKAFAADYTPSMSFIAASISLLSIFLPFLSEYSALNIGISRIGENFKKMMGNQPSQRGDVEIILPGQQHQPSEKFGLDKGVPKPTLIIILIVIACLFWSYDLVNFYILGDGLESDTGPISNF